MKVALLSNVNSDFVLRILAKKMDCVPSVGYGNVWGQILDMNSSLNKADPSVLFFLIDIEQLVERCTNINDAVSMIDEWFSMLDSNLEQEKDYFISDVMFRSDMLTDNDSFFEHSIIERWMDDLKMRVSDHPNVHLLCLNKVITKAGKNRVFSDKMWYMGKIPYTNEGSSIVADAIEGAVMLLNKTTKKVLVLDLDNSLWGGVL